MHSRDKFLHSMNMRYNIYLQLLLNIDGLNIMLKVSNGDSNRKIVEYVFELCCILSPFSSPGFIPIQVLE